MKQLSGQDNSFLELEEQGYPQHICSVAIYDQSTAPDGIVRFKDILGHLESRLHMSPIFTQKLQRVPFGADRPYLIHDDQFDLEYHVRHIALPKPGDWRQFCILLARINSRPLDMSRPMWESYVIEGLDTIDGIPSGSFALVTRVHHCVMDGASGAVMMGAIHDLTPEPSEVKPPARTVEERPRTNPDMLGRAYVNAWRKPQRFYELGKKMLGNRPAAGDDEDAPQKSKRKVETRFNATQVSPHRVLGALIFDFEEVREIKNSLEGATINDVLLTVTSAAISKYLEAKDDLPDESLNCGCPIDVRNDDERESGGNMIGFMGVDLCTLYDDPIERFEAIHHASIEAKAVAAASDVRINNEIMDAVPGGLMTAALRVSSQMGINLTPFNTFLTNVPGPPVQLYFSGAEMVSGFGIGPLPPGVGLFHTASSQVQNKKGTIAFSFWADREMLPDPDFYTQCIEEAYEELKKATTGKGSARKTKAKRKSKARKQKSESAVTS